MKTVKELEKEIVDKLKAKKDKELEEDRQKTYCS